MNRDKTTPTSHSIETLRAAAVLMVFANHLHSQGILTIPYFGISGGWLGVQIFFVISGHLIIKSAARYSARDYFIHRSLRIYPAYIFWFVVFSLILRKISLETLNIEKLLAHLLFLQHFFPSAYQKYDALSVTWTLTIEIVWYILAFLLVTNFYKSPSRYTIASVILACIWVSFCLHFPIFPRIQDPGQRYFFIQNNAIAQMPFFFFGAWIAVKSPQFDKAALLGLVVSTVALFKAWEPVAVTPIFITGFGVASLFLILKDLKYKNPRPVKVLSDISYSFYLIHYPILILTAQITENSYYRALLGLALTAVASYASYRLIEKPFMNLARRKTASAAS